MSETKRETQSVIINVSKGLLDRCHRFWTHKRKKGIEGKTKCNKQDTAFIVK